jgi:iron(III) transport system substrate-binding protein
MDGMHSDESVAIRRAELPRRDFLRNLAVGATTLGAATLAPSLLAACEGTRARRSVVAYVSVDDVLAREALAACTAATGIEVDAVYDTEASKSTGLENRLRAERDRPRADLFWSSEGFSAVRLAADGVLAPLPEAIWSSWPAKHRDEGRLWIAFAARARVLAYSPARGTPPVDSWVALAKPKLARGTRASIAIADPRFGTTRGHFAALKNAWSTAHARDVDAPEFDAWLDGLRANGVLVLTGGNSATVEAVVTGECAYGFTDTDDVLAARARGLSVDFTVPRSLLGGVPGGGTMLVPNTISLVAGREGSRADAESVAAWLVSPACEALLCGSPSRNLPLGAGASCDPGFKVDDPLAFDIGAAAAGANATALAAIERLGSPR